MQKEITATYGATKSSTRLMNDRPSPQEFFAQRRQQNAHVTKQLKTAPPPTTFMTQRAGTPLPPPVVESMPKYLKTKTVKKEVSLPEETEEASFAPINPIIVEYPAEASLNSKNVHVSDRRHRGISRNDLGGFFTS